MSLELKYTILLVIAAICPGWGQIEPMPTHHVFTPDYQTYRFEKELYSFNRIDYMFEDEEKKLWLASVHDFKRTNGYQFFNLPQLLSGINQMKGHIIDGQVWNDTTQYLIEQSENQSLYSIAFSTEQPIKIMRLDSLKESKGKLLFYDVIWNENAYEIWSDSTQSLSLKILAPDGRIINKILIPPLDGTMTAFCVTRDNIWFVVNNRKIISYVISKEGGLITPSEINSPANVNIFHSDRYDNIWVSRWDGVFQIRNFTTGFELSPILALRNMRRIFEDHHGNLVLGSVSFPNTIATGYLYLREGGRWITLRSLIHQNQDLHFFAGHDFSKEIFLAANNNLSTLRFTENPLSKSIINRQDQRSNRNFLARGLYKTDSIFYALAVNKGLMIKDLITGKERIFRFRNPRTQELLNFERLSTIEVDTAGSLWFSTSENIENSEANYLIHFNTQSQRSEIFPFTTPITAIQSGMNTGLWLANQIDLDSQMISQYDVRQSKVLKSWNVPINVGRINDVHPLGSDSLFIATDMGFFKYNLIRNELSRVHLQSNTQLQTTIFSIFEFDGTYFLAGRDGLFIFTPGNPDVQHYNIGDGLRNNIITAVFRENQHKYWLGTFYGITMLNLKENLILNYSIQDGLPENEFNLNSYYQDESGYYLGYSDGVIRLDLRDSMVRYFEDFELDHALLYHRNNEKPEVLFPIGNHLNIPPDVTYLQLFPSSYASYFIDNFHFKLINSTRKDTITFTAVDGTILSKLDAGTYEFILKSYDRYGNILTDDKIFTVTINQHFYQAVWFRIFLLLLGNIIIGYLIYRWLRTRNRKRRKAEDLVNRLSELELQVLQAQLNPHFIFNIISAIQYYIQDHDEDRADMYLTSFSRLMRMYLDSSKSSYIPLNTELALLSNYLDLEIMVSDGKFEAHYEIDPNLDLEKVVIPTMTIQPFVENAIQHGLFHKRESGNIYLRFILLSDDVLLCEVEDDGIGRSEADSINRQKLHKPASRALQIINEKLEVLKATRGLNIDIEIIDKYHEKESMGTLVQIRFPVIQRTDVSSLVRL